MYYYFTETTCNYNMYTERQSLRNSIVRRREVTIASENTEDDQQLRHNRVTTEVITGCQ